VTRIIDSVTLDNAATGGQTATVAEPSLACSGRRLMVAGNWFASRSTDAGEQWTFLNPFSEFPADSGSFCCDQLLTYVRSHRLWVWLLQYSAQGSGNIVRLAISSTGAPGSWTWWDTAPVDVNAGWDGWWFDYPDMYASDGHLLLSSNLYGIVDSRWKRACVLRIPLDELRERGALDRSMWSTDRVGSLRFARGSAATAWFASHAESGAAVELFSWDDDETQVDTFRVDVGAWNDSDYRSVLMGGTDWLARADGRITASWLVDRVLGFAWNAGADATHDHPYIRSSRIALDTMTVVDEPNLWSSDRAWAYPSVGLNRRGDVGITAFTGGPSEAITHTVGHLGPDGTWQMKAAAVSSHDPRNAAWGDYLDIQPDPTRRTYWMATGFTLQGGSARSDIVPHVVTFAP